jgi:hypothetical protein
VELGEFLFEDSWAKAWDYLKAKLKKGMRNIAQVIECLPSKREALGSNPAKKRGKLICIPSRQYRF